VLHPITVTMDSVKGFFTAWTDGSTWNGFACPLFAHKVALAIASDLGDMTHHTGQDAFIWHPADREEPEVFAGIVVQLPGRTETLYPIGTDGWCWQAVENVMELRVTG
jgi:hypothetical protein